MVNGLSAYFSSLKRRIGIGLVVIVFAFALHRLSLTLHQQVIGGLAFIVIFSAGLLYYYISMFHAKSIRTSEFLLSLISVFLLTITMFAIIYNEPLSSDRTSFIQNGERLNDLPFGDALYFSTVTITTLGYGDIAPLGAYRYFAMAEVILGLVYMGTILYFVTSVLGGPRNPKLL
jgi:hypothetical protein